LLLLLLLAWDWGRWCAVQGMWIACMLLLCV
jgi:hypothetical protein